jgi:hypothetical protein
MENSSGGCLSWLFWLLAGFFGAFLLVAQAPDVPPMASVETLTTVPTVEVMLAPDAVYDSDFQMNVRVIESWLAVELHRQRRPIALSIEIESIGPAR